jgi:hypothetical protein
MPRFSFAPVILVLVSAGCGWPYHTPNPDTPGTVRLDLALTWQGDAYEIGEEVTDHMAHPIRLDNLQMYFSSVALREVGTGNWIQPHDNPLEVHLVDFKISGQYAVTPFPQGTYDAIQFGLGIPEEINTDMDPASYPNDHPLSVSGSAGMFWSWLSGYIFFKYEGKTALETGDPLELPVSYHCGTDNAYRTVVLETEEDFYVWPASLTIMQLEFDAARMLVGPTDSIDVIAEPFTHNGEGDTLAPRLMNLAQQGWTVVE